MNSNLFIEKGGREKETSSYVSIADELTDSRTETASANTKPKHSSLVARHSISSFISSLVFSHINPIL